MFENRTFLTNESLAFRLLNLSRTHTIKLNTLIKGKDGDDSLMGQRIK